MNRSRVTLAMIDAAAMERQRLSPLMIERCGRGISGKSNASSRSACGGSESWARAERMAYLVACRILRSSISSTGPMPTLTATACCMITSNWHSRTAAVICLESRTPAKRVSRSLSSSGNMTAAATTGPARQPRPASSSPATKE